MNPEGKTKASQRALACASEDTRKLNPHLFDTGSLPGSMAPVFNSCVAPPIKPKKRIRQDKPMNKLEQEAWEYIGSDLGQVHLRELFDLYVAISSLRAQSKKVRLANGLWYKVDMTGIDRSRTVNSEFAIEVKGPHAFRGGFENLKMAATQYPEIRWILMWKDQGQWQFQDVLP